MALVFKNTDQLWGAVIGQLSEEIQTKVAATAGKPYVHIRPKSKHLGVKDFKYCVEYASRSAEAYVKVESLNGGEKAKEAIQKFIDCHDEGNILDGVVPQQGAKNKNKWSWAVSSPATELNDELAKWYVETINAFWNFFETPVEGAPEIGADTEEEQFTLIEKMCDAFIVETDDEVYYDAESADDDEKELFINNIKGQMMEEEVEVFESLVWEDADAFIEYLENSPDEFHLAQMIVAAAYCTREGIEIDEDTCLYEDDQLYYFNDCMDLHYEIEIDIDLG